MAAAVEAHWPADLSGLVVTRYGHGQPCARIEVVEAAHPVPGDAGRRAAERLLGLVRGLTADDLVLCLLSGGGSALLSVPAPAVPFADKQALNAALLRSGAAIGEINCVRKHLSLIKGGRLAAAAFPARVVSLIISDVPNDDLSTIASGPTVGDPTTRHDACAILAKYALAVPPAVLDHLNDPRSETPKPSDSVFAHVRHVLVATPQAALEAAASVAEGAGYRPLILGDSIEGEARDVAREHAGIAWHCARFGQPAAAPCAIISGGETTVSVRGQGRGGRNTEFLLALAVALDGHPAVAAIAADTDGIDGSEDNAGAILTPSTLRRMRAAAIDPGDRLARNDSHAAFAAIGDLVVTGPTRTNVNDFRAILVEKGT
ncbi:glycerate kinase [Reyranella sp. CPCC 100927]|nr:glycerate kinase [Reyranella sp. CPCC 100927]